MLPVFSIASERVKPFTQCYRYLVELASNDLDEEGVPSCYQVIDVMVIEPSSAAINELLAEKGLLADWGMIDFWQESEFDEF